MIVPSKEKLAKGIDTEDLGGGNVTPTTPGHEASYTPVDSESSCSGSGEEVEQHQELDGKLKLTTPLWETSLTMPPREDAQEVDLRDAATADSWVKRHPDMVRLTGKHPFNSEPPLKKLQAAGWITPPALMVVRNHGAVPKLDWQEHRLKVTGVPCPCELSMEELTSGKVGEIVHIPVTFICAGNRRKEQNMTKKTVGFNWGCAAVGNSVWTGVRLCDLLAHLGITHASKDHQFVHFEGPLGELPQGKTGSYGTSIAMGWALDRERDVLLAFKQNGELLTPDHGAPLRTLLPGCIGGRMIKWLTRMWVSDKPSENHYHYFDNRVLPPHVDAELASKDGWWFEPDYIINHMNINSAMFEPRHNAVFSLGGPKAARTMKVSGYAYTGGGNKIIRAEISLDEGKSWELTDLTRPEDEIAAARGTDKHWCWAWWETEVDAVRLLQCKEICCRAVDSNQNLQPAELTWNVMGMLNNCLFRIKVHPVRDAAGCPAVWFEQPTMPGSEFGGWMTEDAGKFDMSQATEAAPGPKGVPPSRPVAAIWGQAPRVAAAPLAVAQSNTAKPAGKLVRSKPEWLSDGITMEEVAKHRDHGSAWIVVKGCVYDCTHFLEPHPGGSSSILLVAGDDATEDFEAVHSQKAWEQLEDYYMGPLRTAAGTAGAAAQPPSTAPPPTSVPASVPVADAPFLTGRAQHLPLVEKITTSHDTRIFRFGLPSPTMRFGLPTGMHVFLKAKVDGTTVMRAYTPITDDATIGHVDLLVKVYFAGVHPKFPEGGKMSQHLESLAIGDTIELKGPLGEVVYKGKSVFAHNGKDRVCKKVNLIAGGTGLTPCYQILKAILRDPEDTTQVRLLYANQTPEDILLREELDKLAEANPDRFQLWYTVDRIQEGTAWTFSTGFVNEEMLSAHLFPAGDGVPVLMCGPPVMLERACVPNLQKLGFSNEDLIAF